MTNEELAVAIRDGNLALIGELWERVESFVAMKARDRLATAEGNVTDTDDLTQSGYFALLSATQTFDPDGGRNFLSWLDYHLKNAFASTASNREIDYDKLNAVREALIHIAKQGGKIKK